MNLALWFLLALATFRLARVISIDTISEPVRLRVGKMAAEHKKMKFLADLVNCPYCTGIWISLLGAWLMRPTSVVFFIIYWLSIAGGQTFLEALTRERE